MMRSIEIVGTKGEKKPKKSLKILWYSVAPFIKSGYGKVTNYMCNGLLDRGYPVIVTCYFGIQKGGIIKQGDLFILPVAKRKGDPLGQRSVVEHHQKFGTDLVIVHSDFWAFQYLGRKIEETVVYSPVDHEDYPESKQEIFRSFSWVAVPSRHGRKELKKYRIDSFFVPHGVDTKIYKPMNKEACKKILNLDKDTFIAGIVAANSDEETRKAWSETFTGIKIFLDNNPDAKDFKVFVHTDPFSAKGRDLLELATNIGVLKSIYFDDPYNMLIGASEMTMAQMYNAFDVLLSTSRREGFCLPALEAQACKVPVIATKFSALIERLNNGACGWLVDPAVLVHSPINALTAIPDPYKIADALEEAYNKDGLRKKYAKKSLAYARRQTWDVAIDKYLVPMLESISEELPSRRKGKSLEERKIAGN